MQQAQRILIVDDNETNRDILEARLRASGYDVLHADDGEKALAVTRQHMPDLILLDIMMPKVDGIEVCRRLKSDPVLAVIPIILVTAKAGSDDVVHGLEAGADEYLTKPVDQKALVARVKALLRLKALHEADKHRAQPKPSGGNGLFLSYSRQDVDKIEKLAVALQQNGWSVWWDRHIKTGSSFDKAIEDALAQASAVIVAWSRHSVQSDWVRAEAAYALENRKLLPVRLDDATPPLRFINVQTVNLVDWNGTAGDDACKRLFADLSELIGNPI